MKLEITHKGVSDKNGKEIAVGSKLTVKGDDVPAYLLNKCKVVGAPPKDADEVTNADPEPQADAS